MKKKSISAILLVAAGVVCAACAKSYIPNTEIPDTKENREIISFCERYRQAVQDLNMGLLLSFVSPRYFDNAGTPGAEDDMDKPGLENALKTRFGTVKSIRYEIKYRDIFYQDQQIFVDFTYTMSLQYEINGVTKWANETADNRLEIERADRGYLITSGM
jgi:hypothetical protein